VVWVGPEVSQNSHAHLYANFSATSKKSRTLTSAGKLPTDAAFFPHHSPVAAPQNQFAALMLAPPADPQVAHVPMSTRKTIRKISSPPLISNQKNTKGAHPRFPRSGGTPLSY